MLGYLTLHGVDTLVDAFLPVIADDTVVARDGDTIWVHYQGSVYRLDWCDAVTFHSGPADGDGGLVTRAPMPGAVVAIAVASGDTVRIGDPLLTIESMKLETVLRATRDGVVASVSVSVGEAFERDRILVALEEK